MRAKRLIITVLLLIILFALLMVPTEDHLTSLFIFFKVTSIIVGIVICYNMRDI